MQTSHLPQPASQFPRNLGSRSNIIAAIQKISEILAYDKGPCGRIHLASLQYNHHYQYETKSVKCLP